MADETTREHLEKLEAQCRNAVETRARRREELRDLHHSYEMKSQEGNLLNRCWYKAKLVYLRNTYTFRKYALQA